jgi:LPPG:FO 2-phospho-L-lactate transferase
MRGVGVEVSARGVAELYRGLIDGFVIDERDADLAADIEAMGIRTRVLDTIMGDVAVAQRLAEAALSLAASLR